MSMPFRRRSMAPIFLCAFLSALLSSASIPGFAADTDNTSPDLRSIKKTGTLRIAVTHFDIPPFHMRRLGGTWFGRLSAS